MLTIEFKNLFKNPYHQTNKGILIKDDCLIALKQIPNKSINLIVIDPPYNIGKDIWDKFNSIDDYIEFMGSVFKECERVLKDNGSFYWFHNDFEQMAELQHWLKKNTEFIFKSLITWDKLTNADTVQIGNLTKGYGNLRNYFSGSTAEYCLYYTFQEESKCTKIHKRFFGSLIKKINETAINELMIKCLTELEIASSLESAKVLASYKMGSHKSRFDLLSEETYNYINKIEKFNYTYQELREEYESLKCTFNKPNVKIKGTSLEELKNNLRNITTVWNFNRPKTNYKLGHMTPKPVEMIKHIIQVSSNEGDMVLDCFSGSGTLSVACEELNRQWICIEKEQEYCNATINRLKDLHNRYLN